MREAFGLLLFVLVLGGIGVICLLLTVRVQRWAIKSVEQGPTGRIPPLTSFVRSRSYLLAVRAAGIIALLMAGFLLWAQLLGTREVAGRNERASDSLQPRTVELLAPVLEARYAEQEAGKVSEEPSRALGKLLEDKSPETDEAVVVLLGYYLGEANDEDVMHDLTKRGKRILPYLHRYRDKQIAFPGRPYIDLLRISETDRREFFDTVIEAVEKGEVIGVD